MSRGRLSSCATVVVAAAVASLSTKPSCAYADGPFRFNPFSSGTHDSQVGKTGKGDSSNDSNGKEESKGEGFDPEALERGAKALREINSSPNAKSVFDLMRQQEKTRLAELEAEKSHYQAIQAQVDIDRQRKVAEEHRNMLEQQAQGQAQLLRYEDELARKRMQTDHETQRKNNVELAKMQEESSIRTEQARRATEERIQAQQLQTEKERAEIERETIKVKALAEAEGRAHEAKLSEEQNRRMLVDRISGEREKWLAAINTTFSHIEGGFRTLLTDKSKLTMAIGGATALAAGVYTTREGARVTWGYINRILGQPSLIRESSMPTFPFLSSAKSKFATFSTKSSSMEIEKSNLKDVILHPSLKKRIEHLAKATANTKIHHAPFRNMLFYGPPGTGKTLVAREIARKSGLDYAMMTGGDVAPLGADAVTKIHQIFDWAKKSRKGLLLFIDEADAFLSERNSAHFSEAQRSALNALLYRTGDQSNDIVLVLATNRPGDLDRAVTDRIDDVIEFPLPGEEERFKLIQLYLSKYITRGDDANASKFSVLKKPPKRIVVDGISDDLIREAAKKIEGFSGREIAKLMAGVQAAVYCRPDCVLDGDYFRELVDYKVAEHHRRISLA